MIFVCNFFNLLHDDPNNYHSITLLSCLRKLFTACLDSRIFKYMFNDTNIGCEQAGFRTEFHHIFTLHTIIENYKSKKVWKYCTFIDYSK